MKSNLKQSFIATAAALLLGSLTACGGGEATAPTSASLSQSQPAVASTYQSESESSPTEKK